MTEMTNSEKPIDSFVALSKALDRLQEALKESPKTNVLAVDGTIQRFEFCIELFWKVLRKFLAQEGYETKSPRQALQEAYQMEWIHDEKLWIQMLNDRNETSHTYNDETANRIYSHINNYYIKMREVYEMVLKAKNK